MRGRVWLHRPHKQAHGITPACAGKREENKQTKVENGDHPRVRGEEGHHFINDSGPVGSPPRARGRDHVVDWEHLRIGITPACAGKSALIIFHSLLYKDHPRVRGEEL